MSIIVDEDEPLFDVEDPPFEPRDVQVRHDKWVEAEFDVHDFLGRGKFGEVKRCTEKTTGREFAAKFICAPRAQDKKEVEHEVDIMKKLQHKRLLQLYDCFCSKSEMCLVLEIILGGELFDRVIDDDFILTERACVVFMRQICEGVEYMHSKNIIHLDMKPENILCLTRTGNRIKIIDFGLAREYAPKKDIRVLFGTPEFMAPEVVQYDPIDFATDMWSVGVVCYVLLSGLSPFMGDNDGETLCNVIKGEYDFNYAEFDDVSEEAKEVIRNLLIGDKSKRMTATECLNHPWLRREEETLRLSQLPLSKRRLKRFVYRRKWQKIVNAIIALKRMGVRLMALRRRRSLSESIKPQESIFGWEAKKDAGPGLKNGLKPPTEIPSYKESEEEDDTLRQEQAHIHKDHEGKLKTDRVKNETKAEQPNISTPISPTLRRKRWGTRDEDKDDTLPTIKTKDKTNPDEQISQAGHPVHQEKPVTPDTEKPNIRRRWTPQETNKESQSPLTKKPQGTDKITGNRLKGCDITSNGRPASKTGKQVNTNSPLHHVMDREKIHPLKGQSAIVPEEKKPTVATSVNNSIKTNESSAKKDFVKCSNTPGMIGASPKIDSKPCLKKAEERAVPNVTKKGLHVTDTDHEIQRNHADRNRDKVPTATVNPNSSIKPRLVRQVTPSHKKVRKPEGDAGKNLIKLGSPLAELTRKWTETKSNATPPKQQHIPWVRRAKQDDKSDLSSMKKDQGIIQEHVKPKPEGNPLQEHVPWIPRPKQGDNPEPSKTTKDRVGRTRGSSVEPQNPANKHSIVSKLIAKKEAVKDDKTAAAQETTLNQPSWLVDLKRRSSLPGHSFALQNNQATKNKWNLQKQTSVDLPEDSTANSFGHSTLPRRTAPKKKVAPTDGGDKRPQVASANNMTSKTVDKTTGGTTLVNVPGRDTHKDINTNIAKSTPKIMSGQKEDKVKEHRSGINTRFKLMQEPNLHGGGYCTLPRKLGAKPRVKTLGIGAHLDVATEEKDTATSKMDTDDDKAVVKGDGSWCATPEADPTPKDPQQVKIASIKDRIKLLQQQTSVIEAPKVQFHFENADHV